MLRLQRLCGKNRNGASVPLCIRLKGAVVCGMSQHQRNRSGGTCPKDSVKRSAAQDMQPFSPNRSLVCDSEDSKHCEQPLGKESSSGKVFNFIKAET